MPPSGRSTRLGAPLMHAFRAAHRAKDARKPLDLRDQETGERVIAGRRASGRGTVNEKTLRGEVSQDLEALFNTVNLAASEDISGHPEVLGSILNFGIPDIVHRTIDEEGVEDIVQELELALKRFEPRIVPRSLNVRRDTSIDKTELKVRFIVVADLHMNPENIPVEFIADVEVDSGKIAINRL